MKLLSAVFDTVLIPMAVVADVLNPWPILLDGKKSLTRKQIEAVEENLDP